MRLAYIYSREQQGKSTDLSGAVSESLRISEAVRNPDKLQALIAELEDKLRLLEAKSADEPGLDNA